MSAGVLFDAPGPRAKRLYAVIGAASIVILLLIALVRARQAERQGPAHRREVEAVPDRRDLVAVPDPRHPRHAQGAAISVVFASVLGVLLGVGRLSSAKWIRWPSSVVVEFFRSVPVLLMMLFAYFLYGHYETFPPDQLALAGVVTGLTFYNGSVIAELVRSGVHSLPKGQNEAVAGDRPAPPVRRCGSCCCRRQSPR